MCSGFNKSKEDKNSLVDFPPCSLNIALEESKYSIISKAKLEFFHIIRALLIDILLLLKWLKLKYSLNLIAKSTLLPT